MKEALFDSPLLFVTSSPKLKPPAVFRRGQFLAIACKQTEVATIKLRKKSTNERKREFKKSATVFFKRSDLKFGKKLKVIRFRIKNQAFNCIYQGCFSL